jgi:hypothetical protein
VRRALPPLTAVRADVLGNTISHLQTCPRPCPHKHPCPDAAVFHSMACSRVCVSSTSTSRSPCQCKSSAQNRCAESNRHASSAPPLSGPSVPPTSLDTLAKFGGDGGLTILPRNCRKSATSNLSERIFLFEGSFRGRQRRRTCVRGSTYATWATAPRPCYPRCV